LTISPPTVVARGMRHQGAAAHILAFEADQPHRIKYHKLTR